MELDSKDAQIAQLEADLAQQIEVNLKLHENKGAAWAIATARLQELDKQLDKVGALEYDLATARRQTDEHIRDKHRILGEYQAKVGALEARIVDLARRVSA